MTDLDKKILVIDPNRSERNDITTYLRSMNFSVETGNGLREAVEKINKDYFEYLIMDVELPEMKGYEAISIIKGIAPEIKIIMTVKKNSKRLETKVRKQDILFYFIKSFKKEELKIAITNASENRQQINRQNRTDLTNNYDSEKDHCKKV